MRFSALFVLLAVQLPDFLAYIQSPSLLPCSRCSFRSRDALTGAKPAAWPAIAGTSYHGTALGAQPKLAASQLSAPFSQKRVSSSLLPPSSAAQPAPSPAEAAGTRVNARLREALKARGFSPAEIKHMLSDDDDHKGDDHDDDDDEDDEELEDAEEEEDEDEDVEDAEGREELMRGASVGIDLGTTYSLVGYVKDGKPTLIPDEHGNVLLPSVVAYLPNGTVLVGDAARAQQLKNPQNTYAYVKRVIGRTARSARLADERLFGLNVIEEGGRCKISCPALNRTLWPEEVSAEVAKTLIRRAEKHLGQPVTRAVVSTPVYFQLPQIEATERAIQLAGVKKVKVLPEPVAAALAYGYNMKEEQLILVVDLGGGTLDVAALKVGNGAIEVLATSGDSRLGGKDFNQCVVDWLAKQVIEQKGQDPRRNAAKLQRLEGAAEAAKKMLTTHANVTITVRNVQPGIHLDTTLTRKKFVQLCKYPLTKMLAPIREVAVMAGIDLPGDRGVPREPPQTADAQQPELKPLSKRAAKLAEQAAKRAQEEQRRKERSVMLHVRALRRATGDHSIEPFPAGTPVDDVLLVGGASRMPCIAATIEALTGVVPKQLISPDEAVALGATVQAGLNDGTIENVYVVSPFESALLRSLHMGD